MKTKISRLNQTIIFSYRNGLESRKEEEEKKKEKRSVESKGNVGMAGEKGSRGAILGRFSSCGDSLEGQKGRLTSVADVRLRFDPMAEEAIRFCSSS